MRVDPLLPRAEKLTLTLEAIGDDKVLANEALEVVALEKQVHVCRAPRSAKFLNIDPLGFSEAGYGS
jgi:hypothetical protein